jgi:hypothetical protein
VRAKLGQDLPPSSCDVVHAGQHADRHFLLAPLAQDAQGLELLAQAVQGEVAGLDRDHHVGRRPQGVERQQADRRRAIDHDEVVFPVDVGQNVLQAALTVGDAGHLLLERRQVQAGRRQLQPLANLPQNFRQPHRLIAAPADQHVVDALLDLLLRHRQAHRTV